MLMESIVIHHFTCRSLSIGNWRRIGQNAMDLVIFYSPEKATMTYYINNDSAGYKIEYPFSHIKNINLDLGEMTPNGRPGGLVVELLRPPFFYMDSANTGGFIQCGDFTEDQQASHILVHHLGGHPRVLSMQLAKLVSLDAFQNRMAYNNNYPTGDPFFSPHGIDRPASQPNQLPMAQVAMYPGAHVGVAQIAHRRQRSQSVPPVMDFTYDQTAMPPLQVQPPVSQLTTDYAPVPQPEAAQALVSPTSSYGTDAGMYPMSTATTVATMATTEAASTAGTATVSDYADPNLVDQTEQVPMVTNATAQYNVPYVVQSPMVSQSPVSTVSPVESSLVVDQSPPLSALSNAAASSDVYAGDQPVDMTEGVTISSRVYGKPTLHQLPLVRMLDGSNFDLGSHGMPGDYSPVTVVDFPGMILPYEMLNPAST